ncbi:MAG TPA: TRAP transporter small permease [Burkholderiaceae bacterium]|nr:TRAP transporter small permease [Burkholderiaceae bacterium]
MSFVTWYKHQYDERGPLKWVAFLLDCSAALILFGLMLLTCIDVIGRYVFNRPLVGATELTEIFLALAIFSAMPVITWRQGHIVVDLIDTFLPSRALRVLTWISTALVATSLYFVAARIFELGARDLRRGIKTDFLHLPTGWFIEAIAVLSWVAAIGLVIQAIATTISDKQGEARKESRS